MNSAIYIKVKWLSLWIGLGFRVCSGYIYSFRFLHSFRKIDSLFFQDKMNHYFIDVISRMVWVRLFFSFCFVPWIRELAGLICQCLFYRSFQVFFSLFVLQLFSPKEAIEFKEGKQKSNCNFHLSLTAQYLMDSSTIWSHWEWKWRENIFMILIENDSNWKRLEAIIIIFFFHPESNASFENDASVQMSTCHWLNSIWERFFFLINRRNVKS